MQNKNLRNRIVSLYITTILICLSSQAGGRPSVTSGADDQEAQSDITLVQKAIACAKSCGGAVTGAVAAGGGFLGLAGVGCAGGVCPMIAATGLTGVLTASSLGAALTAYLAAASEECADGFSLTCAGYVAVPAVIGGTAGWLVIKGYDKLRKYMHRRLAEAEEENEIPAVFVPSHADL